MASPTTLTPPPELDQRLLEPRRHHWRGWFIALAVALCVAVFGGLVLDWLALLPWRGPLSASAPQLNTVSTTFDTVAGERIAYPLLSVADSSRIGVVLDSVQPVDATPGVHVKDAWLFVDTPRCQRLAPNFPAGVPQECRTPMAGYSLPGHQYDNTGTRLIVVLEASEPGTYRASGFDVRYHVGPIHYTTTFGDGYVIQVSAPPPPKKDRS